LIAAFEEFLAEQDALQAEQTKQRTQKTMKYVAQLQAENTQLHGFLKEEMQRNDDLEARSIQAEEANRSLQENLATLKEKLTKQIASEEAMKKEYESRLEERNGRLAEAENAREEAEAKCERVEEAMTLARKVHLRELEQAKKEKTDSEERLRKELEDLRKEHDKVIAALGAANSIFEPLKGLFGNRRI
jgi:chromosome segregation ATPase